MTIRKLSSILLTALIFFGATTAFATDYKTTLTLTVANASPVYDEVYTFTCPESFTITQSDWNTLGSITVKYSGNNDGFNPSKKLVVTVTSTNNFNLKSGENSIGYVHATDNNSTEATTTFEFAAAEITTAGASRTVGVYVNDYSNAAAGTYTDEITYSVEVQSAVTTVTWTADDITGSGTSFTKDGVTVTVNEMIDFYFKNFFGGGTFTTTLGNFTKIELTANDVSAVSGTGWSISGNTATWTGEASSSVSFEGALNSNGGSLTFVFTIQQ